jgi:mRNA interferase RelE/StbE
MRVLFEPAFIKDFESLDLETKRRVRVICLDNIFHAKSLRDLFGLDIKQMVGWKGYYRIRTGDYRIGFRVDGETVIFLRVSHRKDIYKHFP